MGNICGGEQGKQSRQVGNEMKKTKKEIDRELRVLLLGAGESGKSTIFKQMKIIHLNGYSKDECLGFKNIIYGNMVKNMKALVQASLNLDIAIENPENREKAQRINAIDNEQLLNVGKIWNDQMAQDLADLWLDAGIQKTFSRRNEFQIDDSTEYYFQHLDRIRKDDFVPQEQDILRSRVKTTGIVECDFTLNNKKVKMIDVGGQRNERKKWIHCFEGVTAIIFVSSLSEYDQKCYEDDETNRMKESLLLFDEICNSRWFGETSVILFLNKEDLFARKIQNTDLKVAFPEYDGGKDLNAAKEFIRDKFHNLNKNKDTKAIYIHFTTATDTKHLSNVFDAIKDILLQKALRQGGLI